jgi:hypothetical protein
MLQTEVLEREENIRFEAFMANKCAEIFWGSYVNVESKTNISEISVSRRCDE